MKRKSTDLTRRDVLRIAALLGFCGAYPYAAKAIGPGLPRKEGRQSIYQVDYPLMDPQGMVLTTCAGCTGNCPVRGQREVGILGKVDGSPWSPRQHGDPVPQTLAQAALLRGTSCARGQARVQNVHDPFRIVRPLVREGARGAGKWKTLDGDDLIRQVFLGTDGRPNLQATWRDAAGQVGLERPPWMIVAVDPRQQDRRPVLDAFTSAFSGSKGIIGHPSPALALGTADLLGEPGWIAAPHWDRATAVVAWGANILSSGLDPVGSAWHIAEHRANNSAEIISIDPRLSEIGEMANLWLPVRPGGDRALAQWVARLWAEYDWVETKFLQLPERHLEQRTGLGRRVAHRLASALFEAGPGLAIAPGSSLLEYEGERKTLRNLLALARITGAMDPGGAMEPVPDPIPAVEGPKELYQLLDRARGLQAVIVVGDGGVQDSIYERRILHKLQSTDDVPLIISVTTAMNRVAWYADYVVPDLTEFERVGLVRRHDGVSVTLPVIEPVPVSTGLRGPTSMGLQGLLQAFLDQAGVAVSLDEAVWTEIGAAAEQASWPALSEDDEASLSHALAFVPPVARNDSPVLRSFLARGWAPPVPPAEPAVLPILEDDEFSESSAAPPSAPVLLTYRETFGGQWDSDAQSWGARAVRQDNPVVAHPELLETLHGEHHHSDQVVLGEEHGVLARIKASQGIRPDCVAVAVGYGQIHGFDGNMVIDGVAVPAAPRRCCGVAVGPVLEPHHTTHLAWADELEDPSVFSLLTSGGKAQLPSTKRKHHK